MTPAPEPIGHYSSTWGEGPIWHGHRLIYVDIEAHKIIAFEPATGVEKIWPVGQRVGTVVPAARGGLIWAGDHGFYHLDEATGLSTALADPEADVPHNRFNDGKCDPAGRFWAGSMHLGPVRTASSALWCMDAELRVRKMYSPTTVSNGIVWTRDAATMYFIDSPRRSVLAFDFDNATGCLSNERVLWDTRDLVGVPDGMTIDNEDRLWVAFCHGGQVVCYDPAASAVVERILFPCIETTACAFGGPELRDLYVTTGLAKAPEPHAGRLFVCQPGAMGVPSVAFVG